MASTSKRIDIFINDNKAGQTIGDLRRGVRQLNNEINQLTPGTEAYNRKVRELAALNGQLDQHRARIRGIGESFGPLRQGISQLKTMFLGPLGIVALIGGVVVGFTNWISTNKAVEKSLSSLQSLTGASAEDLKVYKKEAIEMGRTTTLSATQAVDAFKLVGSARPELLKTRDALIEVTKDAVTLAEAAEMDLGGSTQAMIGIMNQFGLANEDAGRTINVLAAGSKEGAANIEELSKATDKSGTVAAGYNVQLEENVALLETLAEKNLKGEMAGTQLRNVLLSMQTIEALPPEAAAQLEKFGVNTQLVSDTTVPFNERLREMSKVGGDAVAMTKIFGKENVVAAGIILNNTEKVEAYTKAVTGTNTAYEQAAINTNNLDGDLKSLSSAWEGFNLIIDGSNSLLRPFIQGITGVINWVTNLIGAFKNADELELENIWLRMTGALLGSLIPAYGDYAREKIRVNELSQKVIETVKVEAREVDVLTSAYAENKFMLENANLSEKQSNDLHAENERIIKELTERYPELTSEIDFQTASYEDLSVLQKEITANLVQQAIETAKVAEQERILTEIVAASMEQSRLKMDLQKETSFVGAAVDELLLGATTKSIEVEKENLQSLEETFKSVEQTINDMDLNFGEDFDTNTQLIISAQKQMAEFNKQLALATTESDRLAINAQIEAGRKILENSGRIRTDQINAIISGAEVQTGVVVEKTEAEIKAEADARKRGAEKAAAERKRNLDQLKSELESIVDAVQKFQEEAANKAKVSAQTTDEGKELAQLEISLEAKYQKQIEAAKKLATGTGEIAAQAAEQIKVLEVLKASESETAKALIRQKYEDERIRQAQESNLHLIEIELKGQQTLLELKVSQAAIAFHELENSEFGMRKQAWENYNAALMAQLSFERQLKLDNLIQQFADEEISLTDFNAQKELLEIEHQGKITEIQDEATEERKQKTEQAIMDIMGIINQGVQVIDTFREASLNKNINDFSESKDKAIAALENEKNKGIITEAEFQAKKRLLENKFADDSAKLKQRAAEQERRSAIFATINNGAQAAIKAYAMFGPPPSPLGIAASLVAATATIANVALIKSQPIPQYQAGGYHDVVGATDGKNYNAKYLGRHRGGMLPSSPSLLLASEKGPEYFVPNHLLSNPAVANYVGMIDAIRTNQMAMGGFTTPQAQLPDANSDEMAKMMMKLFATNADVLNRLNDSLINLKAEVNIKQVDNITKAQQDLADIRA